MDGSTINVGFEKDTSVLEIIKFVAYKIDLKEYLDFKFNLIYIIDYFNKTQSIYIML